MATPPSPPSTNFQAVRDALSRAESDYALVQSALGIANSNLKTAADTNNRLSTDLAAARAQASLPVFRPTVVSNIERLPGWRFDTDHDLKVFPHGPVVMTTQPDGWTDVVFKPAGKLGEWPSDNAYNHWDGIGPQPQATRFALMGTFMLPTQADYAACQAIECQIEQCINGTTFDTCAWQFPLGGGHPFSTKLHYFDKVKKWQESPIAFDPTIMQPGKAVSIIAESTIDHAAGIVHMTALTINGERHEFDLPVQPGVNQWKGANYVQFSAFQIDAVKNAPITLRIRDCSAMYL